jgi:hypothetical protein
MKWGSYFVLAMVLLGMMVGQAGAQEIDLEGLLVSDFQVFGEELGDGAYVYQDGEWNVAELFQSSVDNKAFIVQEGNTTMRRSRSKSAQATGRASGKMETPTGR